MIGSQRKSLSLALATILAASIHCPSVLSAEMPPSGEAPSLDETVQAEMEQLKRMQEELEAIESAPLPSPAPAAMETAGATLPEPAPKPTADDIPDKPAPGAEEPYANMLFALGEYERAMPVYREIAETGGNPEETGWALLQQGNCERRMGNHVAALAAYSQALAKAQDTPWAAEASWWTAQVKWRLLWNEESIRKLNIPDVPERTAQKHSRPAEADGLAAR